MRISTLVAVSCATLAFACGGDDPASGPNAPPVPDATADAPPTPWVDGSVPSPDAEPVQPDPRDAGGDRWARPDAEDARPGLPDARDARPELPDAIPDRLPPRDAADAADRDVAIDALAPLQNGWERVPSGATEWLQSVWGTSENDLWVVGIKSNQNPRTVTLHWDGSTFRHVGYDPAVNLLDVWGSSATELWAAGMSGTLLKGDGTSWTAASNGPTFSVYGLFGFSATDIWAVGSGGVSHYTGTWADVAGPAGPDWLWSVWGAAAADVWMVGHANAAADARMFRWDGAKLDSVAPPAGTKGLWSVWGLSSKDVWASGKEGTMIHWDGAAWSKVDTGVVADTLHSVWGRATDDVWAVGQNGTIIHWDGQRWSDARPGVTENLWSVYGVGGQVWVVGRDGLVLRKTK